MLLNWRAGAARWTHAKDDAPVAETFAPFKYKLFFIWPLRTQKYDEPSEKIFSAHKI